MNIKNKKILIVGSRGLIGKAIINKLKNHKVKIFTIEKSTKNNYKNNFYLKSDATNNQINEFKKIISEIGNIDIFINCSYPKINFGKSKLFANQNMLILKKIYNYT